MATRTLGGARAELQERWQGMCADCVGGDHGVCDGHHASLPGYDGPMPRCTCGCYREPWPWPRAEDTPTPSPATSGQTGT